MEHSGLHLIVKDLQSSQSSIPFYPDSLYNLRHILSSSTVKTVHGNQAEH